MIYKLTEQDIIRVSEICCITGMTFTQVIWFSIYFVHGMALDLDKDTQAKLRAIMAESKNSP